MLRTLITFANLAPDAGKLLAEIRRVEREAAQAQREYSNFNDAQPGTPSFGELWERFARLYDQLYQLRTDQMEPLWENASAAFPAAPFAAKLWGYSEEARVVAIPTKREDGLPVLFNSYDRLLEAVAAVATTFRLLATEIASRSSRPVELPITVAPPRYQVMPDGSATFAPDLFLDAVIPTIREAGADLRRVKLCAVCNGLFFAARRDSLACSTKCANVERVRRHRAKRSQYAKNHRRNQQAKKARAALRAHTHQAAPVKLT